MDGMAKDNGMTSKLNTLLRLGLVSKNNIRRAITLFQNPEKAMKNPAYRTLMQEILVDVVDRVLNNRSLFTALRASLSKESALTTESVGEERTKTLLRTGLVKKKNIIAARRALKDPSKAKAMSSSRVYRELMIDLLDSMVKKVTGNPVLFNAFKKTLGTENMDESFNSPSIESITFLELDKEVQELMESHKPTNFELWAEAKSKSRSIFESGNNLVSTAWAAKWYNENGGEWITISEGKNFFNFMNQLCEACDCNSSVDQLDELSPALLKRYKAAATVNADNLEKEGDYHARHLQGKMKDAEMGKRDPVTPKEKKLSMKIRDRMHKKSDARREKIGQAERKLGEETEQIDELSKKTKDAYVAKRGSQLSSMMYGSGKNYNSLTGKKQANAVKGIKKAMGVKEDVEQVDEAGQAKLYRMRYSHGRAWRRGDKKKQDTMGVATYDKQKKEDAKDLNRTGSAFGMRVKRLAGNRKAMGYSESTLIGKQKKLDVNKNKRLDAGDFKALRAKRIHEKMEEKKKPFKFNSYSPKPMSGGKMFPAVDAAKKREAERKSRKHQY